MPYRLPVLLLLMTSSLDFVRSNSENWDKCGGRLERALDSIRRESSRKNRLEDEEQRLVYQQKLKSAPLEMIVSRIVVKVPQDLRFRGIGPWAKVDRCIYEPSNNSVQTRVIFNDLSVSGLVSLLPLTHNVDIPGESCRMSLRLRRAGVEFYTNPIARGRGQMRIRTESSFLEPRFASIYAYGCHPTRHDKQIKRQDKWPPYSRPTEEPITVGPSLSDDYDSPEPRELAAVSSDEDVIVVNESRTPQTFYSARPGLGIWRDSSWVTKTRRSTDNPSTSGVWSSSQVHERLRFRRNADYANDAEPTLSQPNGQNVSSLSNEKSIMQVITASDFVSANSLNLTTLEENLGLSDDDTINKFANKHETFSREPREIFVEEEDDLVDNPDLISRDWQSRENIAQEMEDIFLRGASEALTRYIEKQLHPAIKETLMLSMGYTISYG